MSWGPLAPGRPGANRRHGGSEHEAAQDSAAGAAFDTTASAANGARAQRLFFAGSGLPQRWAGRPRFVVLAAGFGLGHRFLATWQAWQHDPQRCTRLVYLAIAPQPPAADQLRQAGAGAGAHACSARLAAALADHWPPRTPDLHLVDLDDARVRLMLAFGETDRVLPDLVAQVDAFDLDGGDDAAPAAFWDRYRTRQLARLAAPQATLVSHCSADSLRGALHSAGFLPQAGPDGVGTVARFAPRFQAPPPPGRRSLPQARRVAVVGAGLAGAGVARALAAQGLAVAVFEQAAGAAQASSGNPGGLFHGIVHGHDGPHARWLRAAALHCASVLRPWLDSGGAAAWPDAAQGAAKGQVPGQVPGQVSGQLHGLLRGERLLDAAAMRALVDRLALPADYVQVWPQAWPGGGPAWYYPDAGWVSPAALCRHWLGAPGITMHGGSTVARLARDGASWLLHGADGHCLAAVDAVLLCNASDAWRLVGAPGGAAPGLAWPLRRVRGQVTLVPAGLARSGAPHARRASSDGAGVDAWVGPSAATLAGAGAPAAPRPRPLADTGYALQLPDGRWLCGATSQPGDEDPTLRASDHAHNLATLQRLTGLGYGLDPATLDGRVGWRVQSDDRLPLLGPVPADMGAADAATDGGSTKGPRHVSDAGFGGAAGAAALSRRRTDQPRLVPRVPGLYVFTALGSRGISQAGLGGELLAAWLTGAPMPAPASLLDALDPARFIARATRREPGAGE